MTLHSTMSLLLRFVISHSPSEDATLHSTMSLLLQKINPHNDPRIYLYIPLCLYYYTFQSGIIFLLRTLHSTMSLLLPGVCFVKFIQRFFTFHYVSITTFSPRSFSFLNLLFTFHYVSITTLFLTTWRCDEKHFTFHYVSITTAFRRNNILRFRTLHSTMSLLLRY